jgi:hypothetical protein
VTVENAERVVDLSALAAVVVEQAAEVEQIGHWELLKGLAPMRGRNEDGMRFRFFEATPWRRGTLVPHSTAGKP